MGEPNTTCRVCGKKYFCCSDSRKINSWRTMSCSPECYKEYMRRIEESRRSDMGNIVEDTPVEIQANVDYVKSKARKKKPEAEGTKKETDIIED